MKLRGLLPVVLLGVSAASSVRSQPAGAEGAVTYELRQGSYLLDDCLICGRVSVQLPLRGTFTLAPSVRGNVFEHDYDITDFVFHTLVDDYSGRGSGTYLFTMDGTPSQMMRITAEINGVADVQLASERGAALESRWPAMDVVVTESEPPDETRVFTLRIVAAPRVEMVPYELQEGSFLVEDCAVPCGRPAIMVPLEGTFLLGQITGLPNPVSTYRIDAIDFKNAVGGEGWSVTGIGLYLQGGEVALLQEMELEVAVNHQPGIRLVSGSVPVPVRLPSIDIRLEHEDPVGLLAYSLQIIARPGESATPEFRRGDANSDGAVDVSDAVRMLMWLFQGGSAPTCLDTADANDDESTDIADPVYVLSYLVLGGPPPPSPGPDRCGRTLPPTFGCESYPRCAE